jgi:cell wall-associated NlpC family hydrolase
MALERNETMIDKNWTLGFVNRPYKLQRCDTFDKRHLLMPGDLIEYVRGPFSHWAVYLGSNQIVHLPGPSNIFANFQVGNLLSF